MMKIKYGYLVCLLLVSGIFEVCSITGPDHDKVVVCYISTWAVYRPNKGSYSIDHFDPNLCTHAVYAFAGLDVTKDAIKSLDPWQDLKDDYGKAGYDRITNLKKTHSHLKVTLAIGGWNEGSKNYSMLAANEEQRKRFVKSASQFVRKYNFDGLDLDWEYPTQRGGQSIDKDNFVLLVKELRTEFNKYNLLLTSAIGAAKNVIDQAYNVRLLSRYLDFMHIMCYDYGGSWDRKVSANAPLTSENELNVEFTINYLIEMGASPSKIVMGIPFYGRTFVTPMTGEFGDETDEIGFQGPYTRENGFIGYNELCVMLNDKSSKWNTSYDETCHQGITRYHDDEENYTRVAVYDSQRSVAVKTRFAIRKQLAGLMVWSVDTDDFLGDCTFEHDIFTDFGKVAGVHLNIPKRFNSNYPLLRTMNEAIVLATEEIQQENELAEQDKDNEIIPPNENNEYSNSGTTNNNYGHISFILISLIVASGVYVCDDWRI